ncbi:hypothetical protein B5D77_07255 [Microcystis sp. MC19]|jgi:hypothetical protein|nr:hypothetical protein B5D77_07255 [Microcystis sp. MC19]
MLPINKFGELFPEVDNNAWHGNNNQSLPFNKITIIGYNKTNSNSKKRRNYPWKYLQKYPKQTKRLLGINYW